MEEEIPKKPRKPQHNNFSGMKKKVKKGRPKSPKKKYGDMSRYGKIKPGCSDYQKKTMESFMKVREGETKEQWQKRTRHRRVMEIDEIEEMRQYHPLRILKRQRDRISVKNKNKYIVVQPMVREFDFMRFYGIVINFYATKYGIRKHDLELGFYFYDNIPFTRNRIENACVLTTGTSANKVSNLIKEGLIEEVVHTVKTYGAEDKYERTGLFRLTKVFVDRLTYIYRTLGKMNGIRLAQPTLTMLNPEIKKLIQEMNQEIMDIQMGNKPQDLIKSKNSDCKDKC
jgi:predicted transcriptional regulator